MKHATGQDVMSSITEEDDTAEYGSYFTTLVCRAMPVSVPEVFVTRLADMRGYAVLDTACQRTCCSERWLNELVSLLLSLKLEVQETSDKEGFQFGPGPVQYGTSHAFMPACLNHQATTLPDRDKRLVR